MGVDLDKFAAKLSGACESLWRAGGQTGTGPNTIAAGPICVFERIGLPLPPKYFTIPGTTTLLPNISQERLARLVDEVRAVSPFDRGTNIGPECVAIGRKSSVLYGDMVNNARVGSTANSSDITVFNSIHARSLKAINNAQLGSSLIPFDTFLPVVSQPADWYDSSNAGNWTSIEIEEDNQGASVGVTSNRCAIMMENRSLPAPVGAPAPAPPIADYSIEDVLSISYSFAPTMGGAAAPGANTHFAPAIASILASTIGMTLDLVRVKVSLELCALDINRSWVDWKFCELRKWYSLSERQFGVAPARWQSLTVGVLLARNIEIELEYHEKASDFDNLKYAVSFGPFCLFGRKASGWCRIGPLSPPPISSGMTFRIDYMQAFGWVVQGIHSLPPQADPSI